MNKKPILICFGTRPEWLKVKPLIDLMDSNEYKLLFTGQHEDLLKDTKVDYRINITDSSNRLDSIVSDCMLQFPEGDFRGVLVQGDTASAFGCALAAFNRCIKIYYLEAGLRSYNLQHPYPEEAYRQMISRISDVNFAPTERSSDNLEDEKVSGFTHIVGNTVLDNLVGFGDSTYENFVLVTLHRRENHNLMDEWFTQINNLAKENPNLEFILPIHPNPNVQKWKHLLTDVTVVEPMSHLDMILHIKKCKLIISDSGGIQEEATFFNKKVIVCRHTTERPEGIYTGHLHLCGNPNKLGELFGKLVENSYICEPCPYGDGKAAEKIKKILDGEAF
jgi:UDP-N-acetylglucosamine 2-epimerase (non-hydrolysing)